MGIMGFFISQRLQPVRRSNSVGSMVFAHTNCGLDIPHSIVIYLLLLACQSTGFLDIIIEIVTTHGIDHQVEGLPTLPHSRHTDDECQ